MRTEKNISVFLVDDDKMFNRSLEHHLQHKLDPGVRISSFLSGEECLRHLDEHPDIIVLDHALNSTNPFALDGTEVLRMIRQKEPSARVIMLSGQKKMEVAIDSMRNGADDYVVKNDNVFLRILQAIHNAAGRIRYRRQMRN